MADLTTVAFVQGDTTTVQFADDETTVVLAGDTTTVRIDLTGIPMPGGGGGGATTGDDVSISGGHPLLDEAIAGTANTAQKVADATEVTFTAVVTSLGEKDTAIDAVQTNLATHEAKTTNAHGIVDTADLVTTTEAGTLDAAVLAAAQAYVDAAIAAVIDGAPGALDTLREIVEKLSDDEDVVNAILASLAGKLDSTSPKLPPDPTALPDGDLLATVSGTWVVRTPAQARTVLGLGTAATHDAGDFQPADTDLTAIAALTTTTFGRALLALADAAALRTAAGLGTLATQSGTFSGTSSGTNTGDQDLTGLQPLDTDLTAIAALSTTTYGRSLLTAANAAGARTLLGLVIGTDVAAFSDSRLSDARTPTAHAATHAAAGSDPITVTEAQVTGLSADLAAKVPTTLTLAGLDLTANRTASALRTALGLVPGTDVQAYHANLAALAAATAPGTTGLSLLATTSTAAALTALGAVPTTRTVAGLDLSADRTAATLRGALFTGTPDGTKFARDDGTYATPTATSVAGTRRVTFPTNTWDRAAAGVQWVADVSQSVGYGFMSASTGGLNDYVEWDVGLDAGTWELKLYYLTGNTYGIVTAKLDGTTLGSTIDMYTASSVRNNVATRSSISVATTGSHTLRLEAGSKNGSSSAYKIGAQFIDLRRTA